MQHNNLPWQSFHLQWSIWCQKKEDRCFQCQEPGHITWHVMNMDILSLSALTEYPLQEHQHHTTRHTEIATPDWAQGITRKTEKEDISPDHSLNTANIIAPAIMTCTEAAPECNNGTGTATMEAAQDDPIQHTRDTVAGYPMTHHTSHTTNPTHHSSSGYHSQDSSGLQSWPPYQPSKHSSHQKGSHSSGSYCSQGNQKSHLRRNMKVKIEEPPSDTTVQMIIPLIQEKIQSLKLV